MNSCLYTCQIMHHRLKPRRYKLQHRIFMFYLDLDEIDLWTGKTFFLGYNSPRIYSFNDKDHIELGGRTVKENILRFLQSHNVNLQNGRVMLLTNLRTFGYNFNPVSFYFCFDRQGQPVCVVPEIGNTFGELKPYFIGPESLERTRFLAQQKKYFYISPFNDLDVGLDFQLKIPGEKLDIRINNIKGDETFLYATMTGEKKTLNNANLFWYTLCFPFVTLKVITLIHFHAFRLYLKKIPHHEKASHPELQKEVFRAWYKG